MGRPNKEGKINERSEDIKMSDNQKKRRRKQNNAKEGVNPD
jgi:hypothetical protein